MAVTDDIERLRQLTKEASEAEEKAKAKAEAEAKAAELERVQKHSRTLDAVRNPNGTWVAGISPNPGARGKALKERQATFAKRALEQTEDMGEYLDFLLSVGRNQIPDVTTKERLEAWKEIANRTLGKAPDLILTADVSQTNPAIGLLSLDELRRLASGDDDTEGEE